MEEVSTLPLRSGDSFADEVRNRCGEGVSAEYLHLVLGGTPGELVCWAIEYLLETSLHLLPKAEAARGEARTFALELIEQRNAVADFVIEQVERRDRQRNTDPVRQELAAARARALAIRTSVEEEPDAEGFASSGLNGLLRDSTRELLQWVGRTVCNAVSITANDARRLELRLHDGEAAVNKSYSAKLAAIRVRLSLALAVTDELIRRDRAADFSQPREKQ